MRFFTNWIRKIPPYYLLNEVPPQAPCREQASSTLILLRRVLAKILSRLIVVFIFISPNVFAAYSSFSTMVYQKSRKLPAYLIYISIPSVISIFISAITDLCFSSIYLNNSSWFNYFYALSNKISSIIRLIIKFVTNNKKLAASQALGHLALLNYNSTNKYEKRRISYFAIFFLMVYVFLKGI